MTLANDAAPSSTQCEMDPSSLLRLCVADLPILFSGKDQLQPRVFHYKHHLRGTPQGTPLTSLFVPSSGVAAVAKDSTTTTIHLPVQICIFLLVSSSGVAAIHLPLQICRRRILLEAHNTKKSRGEAASFLQRGMLHFFVMFASPGMLRRGRYLSPNDYGINFDMNYRSIKQTSTSTMIESARILAGFCYAPWEIQTLLLLSFILS